VVSGALLTLLVQSVVLMELDESDFEGEWCAVHAADERGCSLNGFRAERTEKLCEYESDCCSPADLTVAGCTQIELLVSEWNVDRNLPLLRCRLSVSVMVIFLETKNAVPTALLCYSGACEWFPHFSRGAAKL